MKLIRFGERGMEKPGLITNDERRKDCPAHFQDWNQAFFQNDGLEIHRELATQFDRLPDVPSAERWGAPIARPGKVIGIGLNYSDHAA